MEKHIKKKTGEKQKVTFECTRQQLWLKKKTNKIKKKPKRMYLYTQMANINFITVRINYLFNSQLVNSGWGRGAKIFFPSSYTGETRTENSQLYGSL